jgi:transcriptional regulator with XRE-family HTH domain
MTVKEAVAFICNSQGITLTQFAERMGLDKSTVSRSLSRRDGMGLRVETLVKWMEESEYQIVLQSANNDDELIIDGEPEE